MEEKLKSLDFIVRRELMSGENAPNIGLIPIENGDQNINILATFMGEGQKVLQSAFNLFQFATLWIIYQINRNNYGVDNEHKVYSTIQSELKLRDKISPATTRLLSKGIKVVCDKLRIGVCHSFGIVSIYHAHAGVAEGKLDHLTKAFLRQEMIYGLPNTDDTSELNEWEDGAIGHIASSVRKILR